MARRYDESDVRVRPGKGSRPRTKDRPLHKDAKFGMVITKDRGRWGVALDNGPTVVAMRAREMGRTPVEVGDRVGVVGDTSGQKDTLARIVKLEERTSVLRRTADDTDPYERIVVANADKMLIVTAVADPPPREGFVERALIAAFVGNIDPILCLTKTDLADAAPFAQVFADLNVTVVEAGVDDGLEAVSQIISGHVTALIGHSGVGKSTLVNRLVPDAFREPSLLRCVCPMMPAGSLIPPVSAPSGWHTWTQTPSSRYFPTSRLSSRTAPVAAATPVPQPTQNVP